MMFAVAIIAAVLGLSVGSFLASCAYRIPRGISLTDRRSFCPSCESTLTWYELIPVLGPALSGWRCRVCRATIPLRYSVIEITTGVSFVILSVTTTWDAGALLTAICACTLIPLIWTDLEFFVIPNGILIAGSIASLLVAGFCVPAEFAGRLLSSGCVITGMYILGKVASILLERSALGFGDVKLAGFIAFHTGAAAFLSGLWTAALGGLLFTLCRRIQEHTKAPMADAGTLHVAGQDMIPFGSFLSGTSLVLMLWMEVQPHLLDQWLTPIP